MKTITVTKMMVKRDMSILFLTALCLLLGFLVIAAAFAQEDIIIKEDAKLTLIDKLLRRAYEIKPVSLIDIVKPTRSTTPSPVTKPVTGNSAATYIVKPNPVAYAKQDLAARLRVSPNDIEVLNDGSMSSSGGVYTFTLLHRYQPIGIDKTAAIGTITPQPYGTYKYTVRVCNSGTRSEYMVVETVGYFDGSYDKYIYIEEAPGPVKPLKMIEQYDKSGNLKARVSYLTAGGTVDRRVQVVTHYEVTNGVMRVKYIDQYIYYSYINGGFKVLRYGGELRTPETKPLCTFYYEGAAGLELLTHAELNIGLSITYTENLARTAWGNDYRHPLMRFDYEMDQYGNVLKTKIVYSAGLERTYEGLVDVVDAVIRKYEEWQKAAKNLMIDIFNPDQIACAVSYENIVYINYTFTLQDGSTILVGVDKASGRAGMDDRRSDAAHLIREEISARMGTDGKEVHINGITFDIRYTPSTSMIMKGIATARVGDYTVGITYSIEDPLLRGPTAFKMTLTSLVNNTTGVDLLHNAVDYMKEIVNPDEVVLDSWFVSQEAVMFNFKLEDGSIIGIGVTIGTGVPHMVDEGLKDAILKVRNDIGGKMGVDIKEVHINGVGLEWHIEGFIWHPRPEYTMEARVGKYTLVLEYIGNRFWRYNGCEIFGCGASFLVSFVDTETGRDYVSDAMNALLNLFNPEDPGMGVANWGMVNGNLRLDIISNFSNTLCPIIVNLVSGEIRIDQNIVDAVTRVKDEVSQRLNIDDLNSIHVNKIELICRYEVDGATAGWDYEISVTTPQFSLTFNYNTADRLVRLTSLVNKAAGIDLLQNAVDYFVGTVNPDGYTLALWSQNPYGQMEFVFALKDGSRICVFTDIATGNTWMDPQYLDAIVKTKEEVALKMAVDAATVKIIGIEKYETIGQAAFGITASVDNYTLTLDYAREAWGPEFEWTTVTLTSFVDNVTGNDYVKAAEDQVLDLFNPEYNNIGVSYWGMTADGTLELDIDLYQGAYFPLSDWFYPGYSALVPVSVDLASGKVTIDQNIADAVNRVKDEVSHRLGIAVSAVHVNSMDIGYSVEQTNDTHYYFGITTPRFALYVEQEGVPGLSYGIELLSMVNRNTGVDLVSKTKDDMVNRFGFNYDSLHIRSFLANDDGTTEPVAIFTVKVTGSGHVYTYTLNSYTGEIVQIIIEGRLNEKDRFVDTYDKDGNLITHKEITNIQYDSDGRCISKTITTYVMQDGKLEPVDIQIISNVSPDPPHAGAGFRPEFIDGTLNYVGDKDSIYMMGESFQLLDDNGKIIGLVIDEAGTLNKKLDGVRVRLYASRIEGGVAEAAGLKIVKGVQGYDIEPLENTPAGSPLTPVSVPSADLALAAEVLARNAVLAEQAAAQAEVRQAGAVQVPAMAAPERARVLAPSSQ